jgi:DNA repair exonuclease SbcCD ATPase subunit
LAEQQLAQSLKKAESLPTVEAELQQRMAALSAAEKKHLSAEERMQALERQVEERHNELARAMQREKMNEEHNHRLSSTVDKLLSESNDRLQLHLKERMQALEEKNRLMHELDQTKKMLDQSERFKDRMVRENEEIRAELEHLTAQLYSLRTAQFHMRMHAGSGVGGGVGELTGAPTMDGQAPPPTSLSMDMQAAGSTGAPPPVNGNGGVNSLEQMLLDALAAVAANGGAGSLHRQVKDRLALVNGDEHNIQTLNEQEWDRMQQAHILANVQQAFQARQAAAAAAAAAGMTGPPPQQQFANGQQTSKHVYARSNHDCSGRSGNVQRFNHRPTDTGDYAAISIGCDQHRNSYDSGGTSECRHACRGARVSGAHV